jgi:site-specific recombinase XerD
MGKVNAQLKPQQIMKTMQDFEKENTMMAMKEEMSPFLIRHSFV